MEAVEVGQRIPERAHVMRQADLIRYAGASGDFNPLHWDPSYAQKVSPTGGVIAHGMLSMGLLSATVTDWVGDPALIRGLTCSFRAPCPVGAKLTFGGEVIAVDSDTKTATLAVWAVLDDGAKVIDGRTSRAVIRLP